MSRIFLLLPRRKTETFYSSFCGGGPQGCNMRFNLTVSTLESQPHRRDDTSAHLAHLKLDPPNRLPVRDSKVRIQSRVSDDRCKCVSVLVR